MMDRDPYLPRPPWARLLQAAFFVTAYLLTAVTGVSAIVRVAEWPAQQAGWALVAGSVLAIAGVATRLYNLELVALWPLVTGYASIIVWMLLNDAALGTWIVGALIPWLALRILTLSLVARRARVLHAEVVGNADLV